MAGALTVMGVWRVAEDDPDSDLYAESLDAAGVLRTWQRTPET